MRDEDSENAFESEMHQEQQTMARSNQRRTTRSARKHTNEKHQVLEDIDEEGSETNRLKKNQAANRTDWIMKKKFGAQISSQSSVRSMQSGSLAASSFSAKKSQMNASNIVSMA